MRYGQAARNDLGLRVTREAVGGTGHGTRSSHPSPHPQGRHTPRPSAHSLLGEPTDFDRGHEADRAQELAGQGHLLRLWMLPGEGRALGLWRAQDAAEMQAILVSLPLYAWMNVQTTPLTPHPLTRR